MAARRSATMRKRDPSPPAAEPCSRTATDLDPIVHERVRLAIVSALAVRSKLAFADLKSLLGLTDGNLSVHARKLEDAGYVTCSKSFAGRVPRTEYRLTAAGRRALDRYLEASDTPTVFGALFGDRAAAELGYAPVGLPPHAGFAVGVALAKQSGRTPIEALHAR